MSIKLQDRQNLKILGTNDSGLLEKIEFRHFGAGTKGQHVSRWSFEYYVRKKLAQAGIQINGYHPSDIQILDTRAYKMIALNGSLGLGESYMAGYWKAERTDLFIEKLFRSPISHRRYSPAILGRLAKSILLNLQSKSRSKIVCNVHYDVGNQLFQKMLDSRMVYTCAYWKNSNSLEEAQIAKLDLICKKLGLKPGMRVLDIGCGFGSFMKYAAENYGVECVGYSLSQQQIVYGEQDCAGLPIKFIYEDYRSIQGKFDRVVSIGMMEAVGHKNFRKYMKVIHNSLKEDGIALVHTVGHNISTKIADPWVDKYIFPNGALPSIAQIGKAIEGLFTMEDWHNFGPDYNRTLLAWNEKFQQAWPDLESQYSEQFKRMWEFYLLSFAGGFKARNWQLWQIVFTKKGRRQPDCRLD